MYSKIKNVQIIVSLLKQHNIRHIVLSAGTRHVPIAHSVENDDFFVTYSVVDERSAGYYAIGLSKQLGEPVALACTSSTATCNYTPAVAEAYYQKVPLLLLTGDRDPYNLDQLEDQMIDQVDMYRNFCRKCVDLPVVENDRDVWYCQRLVNEAILELDHHGRGPVQINFHINQSITDIADASVLELPKYNKIERLDSTSSQDEWAKKAEILKNKKNILIVVGSRNPASEELKHAIDAFESRYNCVVATEKLSNLWCSSALDSYCMAESITGAVLRKMHIDLVVFFGGNYLSRMKTMLRGINDSFESWIINDDGAVMDQFQNLTCIFECSPETFFEYFAELNESGKNDGELYGNVMAMIEGIKDIDVSSLPAIVNKYAIADAKFKKLPEPTGDELISEDYLSSFLAMNALSKRIPEKSLMHLSILNSTRIMQLFKLRKDIQVYSNLGTDGIDGSMSTFLGQSRIENDKACYLVIGDLSFFYDMNSVGIRNIGKNVHIMLINNGGGAEFYFSMGPQLLPNIDMHIAAAHSHKAKEWVEANGFRYYSARNAAELNAVIDEFAANDHDTPVFLEVFTEKEKDVKILKGYRRAIGQDLPAVKVARKLESVPLVHSIANTETGKKIKDYLKDKLKKFI